MVFEVANLVMYEIPTGVVPFGMHLAQYVEKKTALPELPDDLKSNIEIKHVELICSLRSNYLSRILVRAMGDRSFQVDSTKFDAVKIRELISKNHKKILEVDRMIGTPDASTVSAMWGAIMTDIVKTGTFETCDVIAEFDKGKGKDDSKNITSSATGESANPTPEETTSAARIVSLSEIYTHGCKAEDPSKTPSLHVASIDELYMIRLAIEADMIKHSRTRYVVFVLVDLADKSTINSNLKFDSGWWNGETII